MLKLSHYERWYFTHIILFSFPSRPTFTTLSSVTNTLNTTICFLNNKFVTYLRVDSQHRVANSVSLLYSVYENNNISLWSFFLEITTIQYKMLSW